MKWIDVTSLTEAAERFERYSFHRMTWAKAQGGLWTFDASIVGMAMPFVGRGWSLLDALSSWGHDWARLNTAVETVNQDIAAKEPR